MIMGILFKTFNTHLLHYYYLVFAIIKLGGYQKVTNNLLPLLIHIHTLRYVDVRELYLFNK